MEGIHVIRECFPTHAINGAGVRRDAHQCVPGVAQGHVQWRWICVMLAFCFVCIHAAAAKIAEVKNGTTMFKDVNHQRPWRRVAIFGLRYGWIVLLLLGILWFPFDWLSEVWPAFGAPFRQVFHNAHDHFIGHTVFFFIIGMLILYIIPALRRQLHWYILGLIMAALVQETIQAFFRDQLPTFTDFNAFQGDALGGLAAWMVWFVLGVVLTVMKSQAAKT
ncbi:hypothetical protein [Dictyobacter aurantiacus]|uniref:VanZ-like domain-containing protein n=1 Tax=Dictyobacter aurantiacus TaxID=1936993 RepID=A0A401ZN25_9CHLR|nr:hypothetical protein [Dictyobacter aurantiacus]GCE08210.1 hypothetical protein KDAU_55390 [Dictyobacter aurantiacus]